MLQWRPMAVGILTFYLYLPGNSSLKNKRSQLKPILSRLHREFNLSVSEMGHQDSWQEAIIACALINNDQAFIQKVFQQVVHFTESTWPDCNILDQKQEIII